MICSIAHNSNTTLVKVKLREKNKEEQTVSNSNTTLVKVKWRSNRRSNRLYRIQIQLLLKLN